jgi:cytochrome c oxidase subunit 2
MADSMDVLNGLIWVYTCYTLAIITVIVWFSIKITSPRQGKLIKPGIFYTWLGFLVITGVSLHIFTYNTIPWTPVDLNRSDYKPDKVFEITVANHQFNLPSEKLIINMNDMVKFNVKSHDLTYGFGLFRSDNTMMFQMQVVPGHDNDIIWQFSKPGVYSIRSTEYSGPKGARMVIKDVVEVVAN